MAVVYIDALKELPGLLLLLIGVIKFILVAMYFMHLKFDSPVYSRFFTFGFLLAVIVMVAVIAIVNSDRITTALFKRLTR